MAWGVPLILFAGHPGKVLHNRESKKCCDSQLGPCHGTGELHQSLIIFTMVIAIPDAGLLFVLNLERVFLWPSFSHFLSLTFTPDSLMTTLPCEKFPRFFHPMIAPLSSFQPDKGRKILSSLADNPVIRWAAVGWKATKISKRPGPSWTRWRHFLLAQHGLFSNFYSGGKGGNWNGGAQVLLYTETRF